MNSFNNNPVSEHNDAQKQLEHTTNIKNTIEDNGIKILKHDGNFLYCARHDEKGDEGYLCLDTTLRKKEELVDVYFDKKPEEGGEYTFDLKKVIRRYLLKPPSFNEVNCTNEEREMHIEEAMIAFQNNGVKVIADGDEGPHVKVCKGYSKFGDATVIVNLIPDEEEKLKYRFNNSAKGKYYAMTLERLINQFLTPPNQNNDEGGFNPMPSF